MELQILNPTKAEVDKTNLETIARSVFQKLKIKSDNIEVSLKITNRKETKELNKKYRGINQPTDVLSFPIEGLTTKKESVMLGDIIIAKEYLESKKDLQELFVHGLLHLLGYDHERDKREWERIMEKIRQDYYH